METMFKTGSRAEHKEGKIAKAIEKETAKLPSDVFLWTALSCMGLSLILQVTGKREISNFVGQWASPFLIMGLYNKLVKVEGHE